MFHSGEIVIFQQRMMITPPGMIGVKGASGVFQWCFNLVSRGFHESFKNVSRAFPGSFKAVVKTPTTNQLNLNLI